MTGIWRNPKTKECVVASRLGFDPSGTLFYRKLREEVLLTFYEKENFNIVINLFNNSYECKGLPYLCLREHNIYFIESRYFYKNFEFVGSEPLGHEYENKIDGLIKEILEKKSLDMFNIKIIGDKE